MFTKLPVKVYTACLEQKSEQIRTFIIIGSKVVSKGKVRSWAEKKEAENIAWATPGVMSVENNIEIDVEVYA